MSKLGDMFVLGHRIGVAATEEASRYDLPQVDVDHLLLALLVGGGPAGTLLRGAGLTLEAARRAAEQVRADQIRRLGVVPPAAEPRPIRDPSLGDTDWTRRALNVVGGNADHSELGLLEGLLDEPSGLVLELLDEAGVDRAAVRVALAEARVLTRPDRPPAPGDQDWPGVTHTAFAPAPVAEVWALISDPARRPEWDDTVATVRAIRPDVWETTAATTRPDGRPVQHRPGYVRAHHRVTAYVREELVEWEVTLPDQRRGRPSQQRLRVCCRPVAGGTMLDLALSWPRRDGWGGLRQTLLRPAHRLMATAALLQYATAISRVLR